jgi:hypothetical protein
MFVLCRLLGFLVTLSVLGINHAASSTIVPTGVVYTNWTEATDDTRFCEIIVDVSNPPSRELVKFITFGGYDRSDGTILAGFLMAAIDVAATDKFEIVPISNVAFNSATFDSLGELSSETFDDGTVMATTDNAMLAAPFINAVLAGNYELKFSRAEPDQEMRTYKIQPAPSDSVASNFIHCMDSLTIGSQQVRSFTSGRRSLQPKRLAAGLASRRMRGQVSSIAPPFAEAPQAAHDPR